MRPSFIATAISAIILLIAIIWLFILWKDISNYERFLGLILIGIFIAIHAFSHYIEEIYYGFNPLIGKWKIHDNPIRI
jgi:Mn2+/Fe2+ NRAMP family transporter